MSSIDENEPLQRSNEKLVNRKEYLELFAGDSVVVGRQSEALKQAHDIRKFEIELYWKRAAYFWAFIAASFAGYFALQKPDHPNVKSVYIVSCLGFVASLAWYFVNRGSNTWQRNWENHIDLLEDEIMGPLYKTVLRRYRYKFWKLTDAYDFSPSRVNTLLSMFVVVSWLILIVSTLLQWKMFWVSGTFWAMLIATLTFVGILFFAGQTNMTEGSRTVLLRKRHYL